MKAMQKFDAENVPLQGSNLIEASAGTGKTYSIAILMLRLILERRIAVKEVLMVTFTKAAVAELQDRIRLFVRKAFKASKGEEIDDSMIQRLVAEAIGREDEEEISERLKAAVLLLDETAVMTIHSFCQQTLNEFAFETGQLFDAETLKEPQALIIEEVNRFWRTEVVTIQKELLAVMLNAGLSRSRIADVVRSNFSGKAYISYDPEQSYEFSQNDQQTEWAALEALVNDATACKEKWHQHITTNQAELNRLAASNNYAAKALLPLLCDPAAFLKVIAEKRGTGYIQKLFADLINACDEIAELDALVSAHGRRLVSHTYHMAIRSITANIEAYKERNSVLTFDDMIDNLHRAAALDNGGRLTILLQQKYKAVFVDEFQDTDKLQYELFERFFGNGSILFYIGDPKQSIYAFRKADIQTYFKAGQAVQNQYGMNTNFRSAPGLIAAMNIFFQPVPDFDTFHFGEAAEGIKYIPVEAPAGIEDMGMYHGNDKLAPLVIYEATDQPSIAAATAQSILDLLTDNTYHFQKKGRNAAITPGSVGVLVRSGYQGAMIKNELSRLGIPAVTIDEATVLDSDEADYISYLLHAFEDPARGNINKALLVPYTGIDREQLLTLDEDMLVEQFKAYGQLWETDGIYVTLTRFFTDYGVKGRLMNDRYNHGERALTNLIQLTEILHKVQTNKQFVNIELINWLRKALEGMEMEGDEYEQRVESDEEAVKIVTIHKSKGLEYPIVYAPFLDLTVGDKRDFCSFRDRDREEYLFALKEELSPEQQADWELQQEQENRRLLYVAVTRAVYQLFILKNTGGKKGPTSLDYFFNALKTTPNKELFAFADSSAIPSNAPYNQVNEWKPLVRQAAKNFVLLEANWRKLSYTFLSAPHIYTLKSNALAPADDYEEFIFKQLPKGNITGNFLHFVFEHIDFTRSDNWEKTLAESAARFLPGLGTNKMPMLLTMISHSLNALIGIGGNNIALSQLGRHSKISEFEFDFPVKEFNARQLDALSTESMPILTASGRDHSGIMNGKIDLFFESNGRYYILDWKSNFLGDHVDNYTEAALQNAMADNNYHLQYMIYAVALKKYLEMRIADFDYSTQFGGVIYLFFRGLRSGSDSGVFTFCPTLDEITNFDAVFTAQ
jgi:exodeoxyribonuclease V beta subunit